MPTTILGNSNCIACEHTTNLVNALVNNIWLFLVLIVLCSCLLIRRGPGQEYVKSSLGSVIEKLVSMNDPLELHPIKVTALLECLLLGALVEINFIILVKWMATSN